ncbi:MAG: uroporphyrinogen-III C-methyltransferase [Caldisericia bacterium]|nr:uroporphyrinogen-III C-methyltransferase [Caldisericia bacterium]
MKKGKVYLTGVGPGDPGLFTLKGKAILEKATCVIFDKLVSSKILDFIPNDCERIYVGKESGMHTLSQDKINELLVEKAKAGNIVVRLKGGDPFVFGRGGEEALFCKDNNVEFEIIPGITSAIAVPAYAGIPVTHRDYASSFAVITGHEKKDQKRNIYRWDYLVNVVDTLVFLMGVSNLQYIVSKLLEFGKSPKTPVAIIHKGTLPEQKSWIGSLDSIVGIAQKENITAPSIIIVGETVDLKNKLNWVENKPLWGKNIIVTRARAQASLLVNKLEILGANVISLPTIRIQKESNLNPLYKAFENIRSYDWIVFTSVNSVAIFFQEFLKKGYDSRNLYNIKIAAIGPATAKSLIDFGLKADLMPEEYIQEKLAEAISNNATKCSKILLPRARGSRKQLVEKLVQEQHSVNEVFLYEAVQDSSSKEILTELLNLESIDYITFTSSSTVHNFMKLINKEFLKKLKNTKFVCIGPITSDTEKSYNLPNPIVAKEYTIDGMVEAITTLKNKETR